jgi:acyl carrier protein
MGLDIVEYVMAVEQEFEIEFQNEDLERIRTVGEFHALVMRELRGKRSAPSPRAARPVCKTSRAFYRLRRGLVSSGMATRKEVVPSATLESLIPRKDRRSRWFRLSIASGCALPDLSRPVWLIGAIVAASLGASWFGIRLLEINNELFVAFAYGTIIAFALLMNATQELATAFSHPGETLGDLARWAAGKDWQSRSKPDGPARHWTEEEAWNKISELLVECQGIDPKDITPDARFVDDLKMD